MAKPVVPIGKNNDGSVSLHAAFKRQSWSLGSYFGIVSANGPPNFNAAILGLLHSPREPPKRRLTKNIPRVLFAPQGSICAKDTDFLHRGNLAT